MDAVKHYADKFAIIALAENEECWINMSVFLKRHKASPRLTRSMLACFCDIDVAAKKVLTSFGQAKEDALRDLKAKMDLQSIWDADGTIEEEDDAFN